MTRIHLFLLGAALTPAALTPMAANGSELHFFLTAEPARLWLLAPALLLAAVTVSLQLLRPDKDLAA